MTELKNLMDLLFDEQPFDDRKQPRRATGAGCPATPDNRVAQPGGPLLRGTPLPGRAVSASACAPPLPRA